MKKILKDMSDIENLKLNNSSELKNLTSYEILNLKVNVSNVQLNHGIESLK